MENNSKKQKHCSHYLKNRLRKSTLCSSNNLSTSPSLTNNKFNNNYISNNKYIIKTYSNNIFKHKYLKIKNNYLTNQNAKFNNKHSSILNIDYNQKYPTCSSNQKICTFLNSEHIIKQKNSVLLNSQHTSKKILNINSNKKCNINFTYNHLISSKSEAAITLMT